MRKFITRALPVAVATTAVLVISLPNPAEAKPVVKHPVVKAFRDSQWG